MNKEDIKDMNKEGLEETRSPYYTKPWRRYFAKIIDVSLFAILNGAVFGFVLASVKPEWLAISGVGELALGVVLVIAAIPLEAVCLSRFGTTIGKFLMGTRIIGADEGRISFSKAATRTAKSYVLGLALGLPLISLITLASGYHQLEHDGSVYWDRSENTFVIHDAMIWWKWLVGLLLFGAVMAFGIVANIGSKFAIG